MRTYPKAPLLVALAALTLSASCLAEEAEDQLLTIPAAISEPQTSHATAPISAPPSESLIDLPTGSPQKHAPEATEQPKKPADPESLITLPNDSESKPTAPSVTAQPDQAPLVISAPEGSAEIVVSGQAPDALPQPAAGGKTDLPVFPKDTSSAVFMVMKTWECDNYDGRTLLEHSIGVYAKESEDAFTIRGLDVLAPFKVTLKESDITLDELLDVVSQKSGIDWGVDIDQKVIYLYPARLQ